MRAWLRRTDWVLWGALACTLVGTAHAEYTLAVATGMNKYVAACVPGALDLYVIRALQVRRDVLGSVAAMVAVNVTGHLVEAGELPMHWGIVSAVGALAPLVLWRVHHLWRGQVRVPVPDTEADTRVRTRTWYGRRIRHTPDTRVWDEYTPDTIQYADEFEPGWGAVSVPEPDTGRPHGEYVSGCVWQHPECEGLDTCGLYVTNEHRIAAVFDPDYRPDTPPPATDTEQVQDEHAADTPPDTPDEHVSEPDTEADTVLKPTDTAYLGALKAYLETCQETDTTPSLRGCMGFVAVGQDRARRLLKHAGYPEETQS